MTLWQGAHAQLMQPNSRISTSVAAKFIAALIAPFLALALRLLLAPVFGARNPFFTFFLALTACAMFGGFWPGIVATLLGAALARIYVIPAGDPFVKFSLVIYLLSGTFVCFVTGRVLKAKEREKSMRLVFQQTLLSIGDAVISVDSAQKIEIMNRVAEQLTGWTEAEAKGNQLSEVFRISTIAGGSELLTRSGQVIPIDDSMSPIRDTHGNTTGYIVIFRDVTASRKAQQLLAAAERRSRTILESLTDSFFLLDKEWRFSFLNPAAERSLARPASDVIGKVIWEVYPYLVGTALESHYRHAMAQNVAISFEEFGASNDRWYDVAAYPSSDGLSVYFRDVTERKRSQQALQQLNEDLKQFTYAASHDLREPVRTINIYLQLFQRKFQPLLNDEAAGYLAQVSSGVGRMSRLVDGILQFSRASEREEDQAPPEPANAGDTLKDVLQDLHGVISESHATVDCCPLPFVAVDEAHLYQLFQNLVGNAIKYRKPDVAPVIHISAERERDKCVFAVRDNGAGIPAAYRNDIFLPFKRLHGRQIEGAGIGLATCKRIAERYGGRIWVESEPPDGSTFYFTLPAAIAVAANQSLTEQRP
jgi:PAS domain S-box-containing protein